MFGYLKKRAANQPGTLAGSISLITFFPFVSNLISRLTCFLASLQTDGPTKSKMFGWPESELKKCRFLCAVCVFACRVLGLTTGSTANEPRGSRSSKTRPNQLASFAHNSARWQSSSIVQRHNGRLELSKPSSFAERNGENIRPPSNRVGRKASKLLSIISIVRFVRP